MGATGPRSFAARVPVAETFLSVVVPAYDEEKRLPAAFAEMLPFLTAFPETWELLVVDDGSRDGTAALVEDWSRREPRVRLLRLPKNRGKGAAVREGMLAAKGRYRLFRDADSSTAMKELEIFLEKLRAGSDVVIASRRSERSRIARRQEQLREALGRGFTVLCRALLVWEVRDYTCGFKTFSAEAAEAIFSRQRLDGWAYDAEILYLAKRLGYPIVQMPVTWRHEEGSKVRMLRDVLRSLRDILQILVTAHTGGYRLPR